MELLKSVREQSVDPTLTLWCVRAEELPLRFPLQLKGGGQRAGEPTLANIGLQAFLLPIVHGP